MHCLCAVDQSPDFNEENIDLSIFNKFSRNLEETAWVPPAWKRPGEDKLRFKIGERKKHAILIKTQRVVRDRPLSFEREYPCIYHAGAYRLTWEYLGDFE